MMRESGGIEGVFIAVLRRSIHPVGLPGFASFILRSSSNSMACDYRRR